MNVTVFNFMFGLCPMCSKYFDTLTLTPETAILGIDSVSNKSFFEHNKIFLNLLIFKLYVYKSRKEIHKYKESHS